MIREKRSYLAFGTILLSIFLALAATSLWVNSSRAATPIYVRPGGHDTSCNGEADEDYPGSVPPNCAVRTIQRGVDLVDAGGTVIVAAGNYTETVDIAKAVTLQGAQAGTIPTDPNGRPGGESIIRPDVSQPYTNNLFTVITDSVTISGFMLDGNNPNLDSVDCTETAINGVCLHIAGGIANGNDDVRTPPYDFPNDINNLVVTHNIIKNADYHGVGLLRTGIVVAAGNNLISENLFYNLTGGTPGYARRRAIQLSNSQYASIVDNKIIQVYDGISIDTFAIANPGSPAVVTGNQIDCAQGCLKIRNFFSNSSPFSVQENSITNGIDGIFLSNLYSSLTIATTNNVISGSITAFTTERNARATITNSEFRYNTTGLRVTGGANLLSAENNFITNNTTGLLVDNVSGDGIVGSIFNNNFANNTRGLRNNTAATINASGNWWGSPAVPISTTVDYTPWLDAGTDTSTDPGFQGDFSSISVDDNSPQTGSTGRVQEGINMVSTSGTVHVLAGTYAESVNLNRDATVSVDGSATLDGNLTISQGTFQAASSTTSLTGNFTLNGGAFNPNNGTFALVGGAAQTIGGTASATFQDLVINNGSGVSLGNNEGVNGSITFTNGRLSLGNYNLNLAAASSVLGTLNASNMVVTNGSGQLCKAYTTPNAFTFPIGDTTATADYTPGSITFLSGTFGGSARACMKVTDAAHPNNTAADYITRYWTVNSSDITSFSADASFAYIDPDDISGTESIMYAAKYDGGVWTYGDAVDATNNLVNMDGISSFSDFTTASNPSSITIVKDAAYESSQAFSFSSNIPGGANFNLIDDGTGTSDSQEFSPLLAGLYTITETVPTGWDLDSVVCVGGSSSPIQDGVSVQLAPGEDVTCTFYNQEQQASITIVKDASYQSSQVFSFTSNIPGHTSFTLVDDGTGTNDHQTFTVDPGSFSVAETPVQNWTLQSYDCTNGDTADNITVDPGESITCTFVNNAQAGSLTIVKDTNFNSDQLFSFTSNVPGGANFTLYDDGTGVGDRTTFTVNPGTYSVLETVPSGWNLSSSNCTNGNTANNVTVGPAQSVTCTFINLVQNGSITIMKNADYHSSQVFNFTSNIPGHTSFGLVDDGSGTGNSETFGAPPNNYNISETVPSGWSLVSATCNNGDAPGSLSLGPGESVICTFQNEAQPGTLTIVKDADFESSQVFGFTSNVPGHTSFNLVDDGSGTNDSQTFNVDIGSYSVSESVPANWTLANTSCDNGDTPDNVFVGPGEDVSCTFFNESEPGSLTIIKDADYESSQAFAFTSDIPGHTSFNLIDDGTGANDSLTIQIVPGSYSVSETEPAGWSLVSATCNNGDTPGSLSLDPGESVICTFQNEAQPGTLTIVKDADFESSQVFGFTSNVPDHTSFNLIDDGTGANDSQTFNVDVGSYSVSESVPSGWTLANTSCDNGDTPDDVFVGPGEDVSCTFFNESEPGSLTIIKDADYESSQAFAFTSDIPGHTRFDLIDDGTGANDSLTIQIVPGSYSVAETVPSGWVLDHASCSNMDLPSDVFVAPGESVTCTFFNQAQPGSITISKETDPASTQVFQFNGDLGGFSLSHGENHIFNSVTVGSHTVTETVPGGWVLAGVVCEGGEYTPVEDGVSLLVGPGGDLTCTFTNEFANKVYLPFVAKPPTTDVAPVQSPPTSIFTSVIEAIRSLWPFNTP